MATLESINIRLEIAARLLDRAAEEILDAGFEPTYGNVEHVGRALAEIFQLQHEIYEVRPKLKPDYMKEVSPGPEADELLTQFLGEAIGLEQSGDADGAVGKLKEFLLLESTTHHQAIARSEIARLKGE